MLMLLSLLLYGPLLLDQHLPSSQPSTSILDHSHPLTHSHSAHPRRPMTMANDGALRTSLLWLAVLILVVGASTHSLMKMIATYVLGVLGISGVLLPDWDYFNRDFSRWAYPVTADERTSLAQRSGFLRFAYSPVRVIAYSVTYGYAMYKWWEYVSS